MKYILKISGIILISILIPSCKKNEAETDKVTDIDGNYYSIITIGTQTWMAENLKTTKYNDGTPIPNITDDSAWSGLVNGAYCDYSNSPSISSTYGRLYNWYVVDNDANTRVISNGGKNVCPTGWHVPTDEEWTTLITFVGGEISAGGRLKEKGFTHWNYPNMAATNDFGFAALPGGCRGDNGGGYGGIGNTGTWWSVTKFYERGVSAFFINYRYSSAEIAHPGSKRDGYSVRCLQDK